MTAARLAILYATAALTIAFCILIVAANAYQAFAATVLLNEIAQGNAESAYQKTSQPRSAIQACGLGLACFGVALILWSVYFHEGIVAIAGIITILGGALSYGQPGPGAVIEGPTVNGNTYPPFPTPAMIGAVLVLLGTILTTLHLLLIGRRGYLVQGRFLVPIYGIIYCWNGLLVSYRTFANTYSPDALFTLYAAEALAVAIVGLVTFGILVWGYFRMTQKARSVEEVWHETKTPKRK